MTSSSNLNFYRARAEEARRDAEQATLTHVRERCQRSEAAWTQLAERAARAEATRVEQEKWKAAQIADAPSQA